MKFKVGDRVVVITTWLTVCGEAGTVSGLGVDDHKDIVMIVLDSDPDDPWHLYEHQVEFVPPNGVQRMVECL